MNASLPIRLLWPYGPIKALFSALAVLSGVGLYLVFPQLSQSPFLFASAAVVLFTVEVSLFHFGLRHYDQHIIQASSRNVPDPALHFSALTNAIVNLTRSNEALYAMLGQLQSKAGPQNLDHFVQQGASGYVHLDELIEHVAAIRESSTEMRREVSSLTVELSLLNFRLQSLLPTQSDVEVSDFEVLYRKVVMSKKEASEESKGTRGAITSVIQSLPELQRQIIQAWLGRKSTSEIAKELTVSQEVVQRTLTLFRTRLNRAMIDALQFRRFPRGSGPPEQE